MDYAIYLVLIVVCYLVSISEVFNVITNNCLENILSQTGFVQVGQQHVENDIPFKSFSLNNRTVGRHVCRYERAVMKPHQEIQSYCKPNYLSYLRKCEGGVQEFCTEYRIVYEVAHRSVEKMVAETEVFFSCCPGWTKTRLLAKGCRKAICAKECQNGGSCTKPNRCLCPPGWTGRLCQTDVDECQGKVNTCDQICINWPGSFKCSCQDGFVINDDGKTCKRMAPAASEESELMQHYENLNIKVNEIEKQLRVMSDLSDRMRALSEDIEYLKNQTAEHQGKTGSQESAIGRLNSLSEQMAIFEERLAECSCN